MKKLSLFLVLAVIAISLGIAVGQHYKNYQTKITQDAKVVENKHTAEIDRLKTEARVNDQARQAQVDRLVAECEKGLRVYETLTASQKTKVIAPVCTAN